MLIPPEVGHSRIKVYSNLAGLDRVFYREPGPSDATDESLGDVLSALQPM